jgi:hypothetical protein
MTKIKQLQMRRVSLSKKLSNSNLVKCLTKKESDAIKILTIQILRPILLHFKASAVQNKATKMLNQLAGNIFKIF